MATVAQLADQGLQVQLERLGRQDHWDQQDELEHLDQLDPGEIEAPLDILDNKDHLEQLVIMQQKSFYNIRYDA